ncbi:MAG: hypothetical protein GXO12_02825 [Epsilonproteobacteria bacterium]|nr:hypothetical protein [Campylobacterota bacterium]
MTVLLKVGPKKPKELGDDVVFRLQLLAFSQRLKRSHRHTDGIRASKQ